MRSISVRNIVPSKKGAIPMLGGNGKKGGPIVIAGGIIVVAILVGAGIKFGGEAYSWGVSKFTGGKASSLSGLGLTAEEKAAQAKEQGAPIILDSRTGVAATIYPDFYDKEADTKTQVYPNTMWVRDEADNTIVNGVEANSTSSVKGAVLSFYVGGSDYYGFDYGDKSIQTEAPTFNFDVATVAAETSLASKAFDSDNVALTADDNADNTADYSLAAGANQEQTVYLKLTNNDDNSMFRLGAIATFGQGDCDEIEIKDAGWVKYTGSMPKQLKDASLSVANDTATAFTSTGYDNIYVPADGKPMDLSEFDEVKVKAVIHAGSSNPTANTGDNCGVLFIDSSYEDDKAGNVVLDFFKHDDSEQVTAVGLSDTTTSPQGLTSGVVIELQ